MNTATQCIILLACAAVCTSSTPILNCRCVKTIRAVSAKLIARLETLPPRPYCNKKELIVVLKDGSSKCLDPEGKFAKAIEKYYRDQAEKTSTAGPKSTATARAKARAKARAASSQ